MKIIAKLILLIWSLAYMQTQAQDISFQLYGKSICNDSIFLIDLYSLQQISSGKKFQEFNDFICLPDTGEYKLQTSYIDPRDNITIRVNHIGLNTDTIHVMSIYEIIPVDSLIKNKWECCDTVCEGYYIDYYNNGQKRMEGLFKKGKPVGKIIYYKIDGEVLNVSLYNNKGKLIKSDWTN